MSIYKENAFKTIKASGNAECFHGMEEKCEMTVSGGSNHTGNTKVRGREMMEEDINEMQTGQQVHIFSRPELLNTVFGKFVMEAVLDSQKKKKWKWKQKASMYRTSELNFFTS